MCSSSAMFPHLPAWTDLILFGKRLDTRKRKIVTRRKPVRQIVYFASRSVAASLDSFVTILISIPHNKLAFKSKPPAFEGSKIIARKTTKKCRIFTSFCSSTVFGDFLSFLNCHAVLRARQNFVHWGHKIIVIGAIAQSPTKVRGPRPVLAQYCKVNHHGLQYWRRSNISLPTDLPRARPTNGQAQIRYYLQVNRA